MSDVGGWKSLAVEELPLYRTPKHVSGEGCIRESRLIHSQSNPTAFSIDRRTWITPRQTPTGSDNETTGRGMGKKGKGRQSGGFSSKSLRANHHQEVSRLRDEALKWSRRETAGFVAWSNAHQKQQRRLRGERPRFALALRRNLNGILDERRALRAHNFRERRRRNGFLPPITGFDRAHESNVSNGRSHPSGWLLRYNNDSGGDEHTPIDPRAGNQALSVSGERTTGSFPRLQDLALGVFAHYIREYRSVMGDEELYGALSILPPESITDLSILLSSGPAVACDLGINTEEGTQGDQRDSRRKRNHRKSHRENHCEPQPMYMDDDMAMLLGQQQHVERLCFRSTPSSTSLRGTLTNAGLEAMIPRTPALSQGRHRRWRKDETRDSGENSNSDGDGDEHESGENSCSSTEGVPECWDNSEDEDGSEIDDTDELLFGFDQDDFARHEMRFGRGRGCNLRLRRLELLDLSCAADNTIDEDDDGNATTTSILLRWFEKCSGITHLSLAGSFQVHHEVGRTVLMSLPELLPDLEVLDVTRCPWATDSLLARLMSGYLNNRCDCCGSNDGNIDGSIETRGTQFALDHLLPTVYYYRGRFELLPELGKNSLESDLWDDEKNVG